MGEDSSTASVIYTIANAFVADAEDAKKAVSSLASYYARLTQPTGGASSATSAPDAADDQLLEILKELSQLMDRVEFDENGDPRVQGVPRGRRGRAGDQSQKLKRVEQDFVAGLRWARANRRALGRREMRRLGSVDAKDSLAGKGPSSSTLADLLPDLF